MNPAFGDLDGDGNKDLLIGDYYGYLYYFKNAATTGSSFPSMTASQYAGIRVGLNVAPFIYDINGDSLNDLIVGDQTGKLTYFWNFGTKTNPQFNQDSSNSFFGGVNVTKSGNNTGYSQPYIAKDTSGSLLLFVGSLSGYIYKYGIEQANLRSGSFNLIDSNFIGQTPGALSTISISDINNDGKLEYLLGNARGGLTLYSDSAWDPGTTLGIVNLPNNNSQLQVYPNPAKDYFICVAENLAFIDPKTEVYNVLGQKINTEITFTNNKMTVNTAAWSNGFYFVRIDDAGKTFTAKLIIEK